MDGTRGYYAKRNKSVRERQLSYDLSDMKNWRGRVGIVGGRGEMKQDGIRKETNHKRLQNSQNKLRVAGGWGMGIGWLVYGHWGGYVLW